MTNTGQWSGLIRQLALRYGVDPNAALAVASAEGLSGGVGDGGHAFGPFQLNDAGGVLTGRPGNHRSFAESPAGIDWAMQRIAGVAKGKTGKAAINAIVRQFERPANPDAEVSRALQSYGKVGGGAGPVLSSGSPQGQPGGSPDLRTALLQSLIQQNTAFANGGKTPAPSPLSGLTAILQKSLGFDKPPVDPAEVSLLPKLTTDKQGNIKILGDTKGIDPGFFAKVQQALGDAGATALKINSGFRSQEHNKEVGGAPHSNHLTGHALDGAALVNGQWVPVGQLLAKSAAKYGLRSGASFNWGGSPDIVHVDDFNNQGR